MPRTDAGTRWAIGGGGRSSPRRRPSRVRPPPQPSHLPEPVWLEPYPDVLLEDAIDQSARPDTRYEAREAVGLAFMVALQRLPPLPVSAEEKDVVSRFATAFEAGDIAGVVALLTDEGVLRMPPEGIEYQGRTAIAEFLATVPGGGRLERFRLIPTRANGQPAFGCYLRDPHAPIAHAYGLMVLTLAGLSVTAITGLADTGVFRAFGLPRTLPLD